MNSPTQWLIVTGEFVAIVMLAIGFCHEKKIVAWENRQIKRLKRAIRRRLKNWLSTTMPDPDDGREIWGNR
jgi:hypothetical protein